MKEIKNGLLYDTEKAEFIGLAQCWDFNMSRGFGEGTISFYRTSKGRLFSVKGYTYTAIYGNADRYHHMELETYNTEQECAQAMFRAGVESPAYEVEPA